MEISVNDPFDEKNMYWGYLHINGNIQVKLVGPQLAEDLKDARESPFVQKVYGPVAALNKWEAGLKIQNLSSNFPPGKH